MEQGLMFVFPRSAAAVILPLVLLLAAVLWSGRSAAPAPQTARHEPVEVINVARNAPPRGEDASR
jgi:hypothetical protein